MSWLNDGVSSGGQQTVVSSKIGQPTVLRNHALTIVLYVAAFATLTGFVASAASGSGPHPQFSDYAGTVAFGVAGCIAFLRAVRMRVELDDSGVTVFKYFTTRQVPWSDLASVSVDYNGLRLGTKDGAVVTAATLGKPNWATWTKRRTKADARVDRLRAEIEKRQGR